MLPTEIPQSVSKVQGQVPYILPWAAAKSAKGWGRSRNPGVKEGTLLWTMYTTTDLNWGKFYPCLESEDTIEREKEKVTAVDPTPIPALWHLPHLIWG